MTPNSPSDRKTAALLCTMRMGFGVLASEIKWLGFRFLRNLEIRQMGKRLNEEYLHLGRIMDQGHGGDGDGRPAREAAAESELTFRQIEFLKDEIAYLRKELADRRQEFVDRRRKAMCRG